MSELKPLPKSITDDIRGILEGCRDGRLQHKQEYFHCGTAHCIGGWKEKRDFQKATGYADIYDQRGHYLPEFQKFLRRAEIKKGGAYGYAQIAWQLTDLEAETLMAANAAFREQFALLEKLERGESRAERHTDQAVVYWQNPTALLVRSGQN